MKIKYQQPAIRVIDLYTENEMMLSMSNTEVDTSSNDFLQRSQQKETDLWGNEDVWK